MFQVKNGVCIRQKMKSLDLTDGPKKKKNNKRKNKNKSLQSNIRQNESKQGEAHNT